MSRLVSSVAGVKVEVYTSLTLTYVSTRAVPLLILSRSGETHKKHAHTWVCVLTETMRRIDPG
jgi:hypothetical protein